MPPPNTLTTTEDQILRKVKELLNKDLTKLKYTEIPHVLLLVSKIVYEDSKLNPDIQKDLIIKLVQLLIDKSDIAVGLKFALKEMIPHLIDKYIELDNGSKPIRIHTYGRMGRMWIKVRTYFDYKILGV